jgi:hypothetical protein
MIPLKDQANVKHSFALNLTGSVRLDLLTQKPSPNFIPGRQDCVTCEDMRNPMQEISGRHRRISLTQHDIEDDLDAAICLDLDEVPLTVLQGAANRPMRYFGSPAQRQFATFIELLILVTRGSGNLSPETIKKLKRLQPKGSTSPAPTAGRGQRGEVKLVVALSCPHSPLMVITAASTALANPHINIEVIQSNGFPALAQSYYVRGTPHTVLTDTDAVPGAMDEVCLAEQLPLVAQGKDPTVGGDLSNLTPPQPQQQARPSPVSGLVLSR